MGHHRGSLLRVLLLAIVALPSCASDRRAATVPAPAVLAGDIRTHDPGMIRQDTTYYVFSTGDERGLNQGNIQIRTSRDLATWGLIGTVFDTIPSWITTELGSTPPNLWAPDISHVNGRYYLYYVGSRSGSNNSVIGLATNVTLDPASPDYRWVDQGMVIRSRPSNTWNAIDPALAFDADGAPWLAWGSFWSGIKMYRIDPKTGKLASEESSDGRVPASR
ncbi:MAG TPA: arabinan endo-1,5-alpha-L-arabinosidase [Herpetosiphonaceae bacterium]